MNTDHITNQPNLIPVSRLDKSPHNARRTVGKLGKNELKASILAHGLMQNLVVTDAGDGRFRVIAGGRRLEAIRSLQQEGKLPDDFSVPCQVVSEDHALEMSLAENTVRLAMHPADQFAAFADLIDQGATAGEVARRFGVEENLVHKRMKLARVAPQLLKKYRDDELTLECLMAFTLTDDHRRQLKVFKSLQDWQKDDPGAIRAAITERCVDAASKLAQFVGLDAYNAAGGRSRADLFGDEVYLEDPALLDQLAEAKLGLIRKELEAEGWSWIEINPERDYDFIHRCMRIQPRLIGAPAELVESKEALDAELAQVEESLDATESDSLLKQRGTLQKRLDEIEKKLAEFVGFDSAHMALAGCHVSIGSDGTVFLDKGLVKPEHRKALARLTGPASGEPEPETVKLRKDMPQSLARDLAEHRLQVAQVEIARHPAIALDLLTFKAACIALAADYTADGPDVTFRHPRSATEDDKTVAADAFRAIAKSLPVQWLKQKTEAKRFEAFRLLPKEARLKLLAYCVALTLKPKLGPVGDQMRTAYDDALAQTRAGVSGYWRPNKDNFLSRRTREQLLAIGRDILGDQWANARAAEKKSSLVDQLDRAFTDPARHGQTPDQVEMLKTWLPAGMGFGALPARKPATAKKARKAA